MENDSCISVKRLKTESDNFESTDKVTIHTDQEVCCKSEELGQCDLPNKTTKSIPDQLLQIEIKYNQLLRYLTFDQPISCVYNPVEYAFSLHSQYVLKFCQSQKEILILGMNPGPWGMSQTGVPFGEVSVVRDWLGITGEVGRPEKENPSRPITGLLCHRSEVSGKRFWEALKNAFGTDPYVCLKNCYIHNYCPLALMKISGKNVTPAELQAHERHELSRICDDLLIEILLLLNITTIVAVGRFAESQAKNVIKNARLDSIKLLSIPHPSPLNARASRTWGNDATETLKKLLCK